MDIRPILSTLARHKTAAALIVLEVALSCAIICNAVFLITQRLERIDVPPAWRTRRSCASAWATSATTPRPTRW